MGRPSFVENPLSLSVSQPAFEAWLQDDGTAAEEEENRRQQERRVTSGAQAERRPSRHEANGHERSSSPLMDMTVDDLFKKPVSWTGQFFEDGEGPYAAYSIPRSWEEARGRLEGNIVSYIGNYVIIIYLVVICTLYKNPKALLGLALIIKAWDWFRTWSKKPTVNPNGYMFSTMKILIQTVMFLSLLYFKLSYTILIASIVSLAVIMLHGTLRIPSRASKKVDGRVRR